jgi:hypothetical protein
MYAMYMVTVLTSYWHSLVVINASFETQRSSDELTTILDNTVM